MPEATSLHNQNDKLPRIFNSPEEKRQFYRNMAQNRDKNKSLSKEEHYGLDSNSKTKTRITIDQEFDDRMSSLKEVRSHDIAKRRKVLNESPTTFTISSHTYHLFDEETNEGQNAHQVYGSSGKCDEKWGTLFH